MAENEDRTEQATPRRREKAREKGQVARSRELTGMATMAGTLLVFGVAGATFLQNISGLTGRLLGLQYGRDSLSVMRAAAVEAAQILAPFFIAAICFGVMANVLQGGFVLKPLSFELEKLSPLKGLQQLFSVTGLANSAKSLLKFVIAVVIFYYLMKKIVYAVPLSAAMDVAGIRQFGAAVTGKTVASAFGVFFVIALADYLYERWRFEHSIRMSKEEIREEFKESEGNPQIKARVKSIQKELARRRMMEAVPTATVVITNPTHLAVALRYRTEEAEAPKVVAKGAGYVAERIRELARKHGVPLVEDKPVARALFKVQVDAYIPEELYRAVAKILAYIYKLRGSAA